MNEMRQYRKKPVVIEAVRFLAGERPNVDGIRYYGPECLEGECCYIDTLEGKMRATPGDWIIRGVKGELYPCKPDIFEATYDAV